MRRTLLLLAATLSVSCLSPTLPLPPPSRPEISVPDAAGMVHIRGTVRSNAEVFAKNRRTLDIVGKETDDSGGYDLVMQAQTNDQIIVWYTDHGTDSDFVEALVPDTDEGVGGAGGSDDQ